jgi:hypothetical protein
VSRSKARPKNPGWFRNGFDPRRHELTGDERRRGHEAAKESCFRHSARKAAWFFRHIRGYYRARRAAG